MTSTWWRCWTAACAFLLLVGCASSAPEQGVEQPASHRELPQTALLNASMRQQPVPGWTTTVRELGLPPNAGVQPLASVGDQSIFLATTDEDWWITGLNVADGRQFLRPIRIGSARDADVDCYVNGPPTVLCIWSSQDFAVASQAWVIDAASGRVVFDGPTEVRVRGEQERMQAEQIADRVVATSPGKGIHGVGKQGELTWFVPGDGSLPTGLLDGKRETSLPALAVQGSGSVADVVFSATDGTVLKPSLPQGARPGRAMIYPGGFAYEYTAADDPTKDRVAFFDRRGASLGNPSIEGTLETGSPDLPMILTPRQEIVSTLDGAVLLELPRTLPTSAARLIGSRLFVASGPDEKWQQFDLLTGEPGKSCVADALGADFLASDGEVVVSAGGPTAAQGLELASCATLWTLPQSPDEVVRVWRVNDTLIERADERLFSLVAPV